MDFTYAPDRACENAVYILQGFDGIVQLDGYTGCNRLTRPSRTGGAPITVAHCWAHARRKLKEVFDRDGSEIAAEGLRRIAKLYRIETEVRGMARPAALGTPNARCAAGRGLRRMAGGAMPAYLREVTRRREAGLYAGKWQSEMARLLNVI